MGFKHKRNNYFYIVENLEYLMKKRIIPPAQPLQDFGAEVIRQLQERGEWDNVEGKGKPLNIQGDLSDLPTMSAKLRKDANFSTPWSDLKQEIEVGERRAQELVMQAHRRRTTALQSPKANIAAVETEWRRALEELDQRIAALNSLILKYNLIIPPQMPQLHRARLRRERVLEQAGVSPEKH
jgi:hypothetical protein